MKTEYRLILFFLLISLCCGAVVFIARPFKNPVQALVYSTSTRQPVTSSPALTHTPEPTLTPLPTIDYRATDQAYTLLMEQERNRMIEAQLAHDEEMMRQQLELARINGTATAAGTQVAIVNAENTLTSGKLTAVSIQATSTAEAPQHAAQLLQVATNAKNEKRDDVIYVSVAVAIIIFLLGVPAGVWRIAKVTEDANKPKPEPGPEVPDGLTPYIREDRTGGDFERWFVPATPEQLTELSEMVVNGERNLAINRIESIEGTTLKRPVLVKMRKWFRANNFAIELGNGEIALNDRAVCLIEKWYSDHELEEGYQFSPSPQVEN